LGAFLGSFAGKTNRYSKQFRALTNSFEPHPHPPVLELGIVAHQQLINNSIVEATMEKLPQGDIHSFLLGQADLPLKQVLVFRGALVVVCSNCQNHFSKQGIQSHDKACSVKPKAWPHGRVKMTGPLYPAGKVSCCLVDGGGEWIQDYWDTPVGSVRIMNHQVIK
jgi:hypothetical protein